MYKYRYRYSYRYSYRLQTNASFSVYTFVLLLYCCNLGIKGEDAFGEIFFFNNDFFKLSLTLLDSIQSNLKYKKKKSK